MAVPQSVLVIACGALAHEIQALKKANQWQHLHLTCLDAELHNRPELIPDKLKAKIEKHRADYDRIYIGYGDCGTGGRIDQLLKEQNVERLPGAHCYSFFAGESVFDEIAEQELGTFYLTDYLAQHFDRLIIKGFKLDQMPEVKEMLFCHYKRLLYFSQRHDQALLEKARAAADYLGLYFEHKHTGYGDLETGLRSQVIASTSGPSA